MNLRIIAAVALFAGLTPTVVRAEDAATGKLVYNRDIRPILSDNCFSCHGNDKNKIKGKLRLNDREAAMSKKAVVPGKPDESELVSRIFSKDAEEIMPPPEAHKVLTEAQKAILKRWVAEGAEYQPHWAYVPLVRPATPAVKDKAWVRTPIDAFVLAELERRKLTPSAEADRRTLLRRLSLDLIGLPPTPAEVDAFVADKSPDAYEKQVDRLLNSPHFGERMAAPWLDAVRFSDSVGYHGDQNQNVFPYRDYVINAFNRNKPFDQFTIEQLAGDLLPKPTTEQLVASGFNRLNMMTREGGAQPKEYLTKYTADRIRTVGLTWLGSTFGCAECHDHKFDPISAKDFYSMGAFFADIRQWGVYSDYSYTPNPDLKGWSNDHPFPPEIQVESPYLKLRKATLEARLNEEAGACVKKLSSDPKQRQAVEAWAEATAKFLKANPTGWEFPERVGAPKLAERAVQNKKAKPADIQPENVQGDKGKLAETGAKDGKATGKAPAAPAAAPAANPIVELPDGFIAINNQVKGKTVPPTEIPLKPTPGWVASIRLEAAGELATRAINNGSQRTGIKLSALVKPAKGAVRKAGIYFADADVKEPRYSSTAELIGVQDGWKLSAADLKQKRTSVWLLDPPLKIDAGDQLIVSITGDSAIPVRVSVSPLAGAEPLHACSPDAISSLKKPAANRTEVDNAVLYTKYLLGTAADADGFASYKKLQREILECRDGKAWQQVTVAVPPMETKVLPRGNWQDESGEVVVPATPHFLPALPNPDGRRLTRLDLAKWIVAPENPLTGRAVTNRFWKMFFGVGLSASVEDLGAQGEWPSHPDLLDWLSVEFRQPADGSAGWDVKHLVRQIVTSSVYRQASILRPELRDSDPANRLLSAQSPRRLEAEFVRDNALYAAGLLNIQQLGGPSVKPYQPEGYYGPLQFPDRRYRAETDDRQYRRGIYMHWQRTFLHPMLANFDAPSREDSVCTRVVSNTPQQALTLLNDPEFVEASRVLAEKLLVSGGTDAQKIDRLFQRVLARSPKENEQASLMRFLTGQREIFKTTPEDAQKLLQVGNAPASDASPAELAAWANTARVVLNLHEAITRY